MGSGQVLRQRGVQLLIAMVCFFAPFQFARAADITWGTMKANKILFLGNSITLHAPLAGTTWQGYWGMAASTQAKDYVHTLASAIDARTGSNLVIEPVPLTGGTSGAQNVLNIADIFERNYFTYQNSTIQKQLDWQADLVVLQFQENMNMGAFNAATFTTSLRALMNGIKASSNPNIFVTSGILYTNSTVDAIKQQICAEDPARRRFVNFSSFSSDPTNFASSEPYWQSAPIVLGHPGDKGMGVISSTLFNAMEAQAVPEPAQMSLAAGLGAAALGAWRMRRRSTMKK
jgi:hypothetical protein